MNLLNGGRGLQAARPISRLSTVGRSLGKPRNKLANCVTFGLPLIEPGKPGRETFLVTSLTKGFKAFPRMPHPGPYMSEEHVAEIARWIDDGMPED